MAVTKPYKFIAFGAIYVTKPYGFTGFGAIYVTKPSEFIGFGATGISPPRRGAPLRAGCGATARPCRATAQHLLVAGPRPVPLGR